MTCLHSIKCYSSISRSITSTYKPQVSYGFEPRLGSGVATCPMALDLTSQLSGLRRCHVSYGSGPRLLVEVGSGAATCPMAPDLASRLRWAPALPCVI
jgi:hypothetical protein